MDGPTADAALASRRAIHAPILARVSARSGSNGSALACMEFSSEQSNAMDSAWLS